jgi:hypothetical protein
MAKRAHYHRLVLAQADLSVCPDTSDNIE